MKNLKILALGIGVFVVSLLAITGFASAQTVKSEDTVTVSESTVVNSMLFASGNTIAINGTVNGDVYCTGQNITISGTVRGDVYCAGQSVTIDGRIDGSLRLAGQVVKIGGTVNGSATVFSQTASIEKDAAIGRDLVVGAQAFTLSGKVDRDVQVWATSMTVDGQVGRNIKGQIESLSVGSAGLVGGDVEYTSNKDPVIAEGGKIDGTVARTPMVSQQSMTPQEYVGPVLGFILYSFVALLIIALVLVLLIPRVLNEAATLTIQQPGRVALIGVLAAIVAPAIVFILLISVIGIPLAILLLLAWLVVVILAGPFVGYLLGRLILKDKSPFLVMLLGASILLVLYFIPLLGAVVGFLAYIYGTGMILSYILPRPPRADVAPVS